MSWNYAREQIEKALAATHGNAPAATRLVMEMAFQDARLMSEIAAPHLKGIVSHAVSYVVRDLASGRSGRAGGQGGAIPDAPEAMNMPLDQFGRELLGALSGRDTPRFGAEAYGAAQPGPKKPVSKAHIEAIKKIARSVTER